MATITGRKRRAVILKNEGVMHLFAPTDIECSATRAWTKKELAASTKSRVLEAGLKFTEMGIGRGGKIIQKIYPDPHGLDVWQPEPSATLATYLVNAKVFEQITGQKFPEPVGHEVYHGSWFGMQDGQEDDTAGTEKFSGLKSAVFPASDLKKLGK